MRYLLMLHADEQAGASIPPEEMGKFMGQMVATKTRHGNGQRGVRERHGAPWKCVGSGMRRKYS
ncbi:hypothetical protein [Pelagibacterium halotolerans]|uniref:hypothetical protein n=1 Tax=Pelagibacterium halotolerans TaxID=531813 RepID=UPI00384BDBCF